MNELNGKFKTKTIFKFALLQEKKEFWTMM